VIGDGIQNIDKEREREKMRIEEEREMGARRGRRRAGPACTVGRET